MTTVLIFAGIIALGVYAWASITDINRDDKEE